MKKRLSFTVICCVMALSLWAVEIHIADPKSWTNAELAPYLGDTVTFDGPMFLQYKNSAKLSPNCLSSTNYVVLNGNYTKSNRDRTFSRDLEAKVKQSTGGSYYLEYISGTFDGNTRETLRQGPDWAQIDANGIHTLLVCAANLEYYLANNFGTGYGPKNQQQHDVQRVKTKKALACINADIYGLCEIEQGITALQEICYDLNAAHSNRRYTYISNNTSSTSGGSYTMSAFVYDSTKVVPFGKYKEINAEVLYRKYMQCFKEKASGEKFIFSMNHFKSMAGTGDTDSRRIAEANAVNSAYTSYKNYCNEEDMLIMGDLNCYYGSTPITVLLNDSRTDLHRYFHLEGSYSYDYEDKGTHTHTIDYLDHAICNLTLLPQVTGIQAYHVNSDEGYEIEYPSGDTTMFRYSDHDPVLVGLRLDSTLSVSNRLEIINYGDNLQVHYGEGGYIRIYDMSGNLLHQEPLEWEVCPFTLPETYHGCFIVHVFHNGVNHVTKYIRP